MNACDHRSPTVDFDLLNSANGDTVHHIVMRSRSAKMFEPETVKVDNPNGVSELPRDFMALRGGSRWMRYENYGTGWNEYVWNYEWVWSDDVGEQTAIDAWMNSEQAAVLMIVNNFGNCSECGRSHGRDEAHQDKCELCSAGMPCDPSCENEAG